MTPPPNNSPNTDGLDATVREEFVAVDAHILQMQNIVYDAVTKLGSGFEQRALLPVVENAARIAAIDNCADEGMRCAAEQFMALRSPI